MRPWHDVEFVINIGDLEVESVLDDPVFAFLAEVTQWPFGPGACFQIGLAVPQVQDMLAVLSSSLRDVESSSVGDAADAPRQECKYTQVDGRDVRLEAQAFQFRHHLHLVRVTRRVADDFGLAVGRGVRTRTVPQVVILAVVSIFALDQPHLADFVEEVEDLFITFAVTELNLRRVADSAGGAERDNIPDLLSEVIGQQYQSNN